MGSGNMTMKKITISTVLFLVMFSVSASAGLYNHYTSIGISRCPNQAFCVLEH